MHEANTVLSEVCGGRKSGHCVLLYVDAICEVVSPVGSHILHRSPGRGRVDWKYSQSQRHRGVNAALSNSTPGLDT